LRPSTRQASRAQRQTPSQLTSIRTVFTLVSRLTFTTSLLYLGYPILQRCSNTHRRHGALRCAFLRSSFGVFTERTGKQGRPFHVCLAHSADAGASIGAGVGHHCYRILLRLGEATVSVANLAECYILLFCKLFNGLPNSSATAVDTCW
jgi:hypothetical protein